jgi:hypothetical protein
LVQAGVFVGPKDSGRAAKRLEKSSLPARVFKRSRSGGRWWHILVVGPYPDFNQASKVAAKVRELLKIEPLVIFAREFADQAGQGE